MPNISFDHKVDGPNTFVPALQGVRGIAITLVVVHHAFSGWAAGKVGVDIFFVLSGFLITSHLWSQAQRTGGISLRGFYAKRLVRLYPALLVVLIFAALASPWTHGTIAADAAKIFIALTYTTNIVNSLGQSVGMLDHTWSLAQEEQFYLVWPLLMIVLIRRGLGGRQVAFVLLVIAVVSGSLLVALSPDAITRNPLAQFGGLALGSALAVAGQAGLRIGRIAATAGAVAAALAIFASGVVLSDRWLVVVVTLCTAPVIGYLAQGVRGGLSVPFSVPPLVWLGDISYSLYLWHYPVFFLLIVSAGWSSWRVLLIGGAISLLAAHLSRRFVERPALSWYARHNLIEAAVNTPTETSR